MSEKKQWTRNPLYVALSIVSAAVTPMLVTPVGSGINAMFSAAGHALASGEVSLGLAHPHRTYFFPKEKIELTCNDSVSPNGTATDRVQATQWGVTNGITNQTSYYRDHTYSTRGDDPNGYHDQYNVGVLKIEYEANKILSYRATTSQSLAAASLSGPFNPTKNPFISSYFRTFDLVENNVAAQSKPAAEPVTYRSPTLQLFLDTRGQLGQYAELCGKGKVDAAGTERGGQMTLNVGETDIFQKLGADIKNLSSRPAGSMVSTTAAAAFIPHRL